MRKRRRWALLVMAAFVAAGLGLFGRSPEAIRVGIVTDVHAHDTDSPVEDKVMTNWAERLSAFVDGMNEWPADVVIELGDLVNGAFVMGAAIGDPGRISGILGDAVDSLSGFDGTVHFVPGNHDFYDLSPEEFLGITASESFYYSFDLGAFHFVLLDAEYNAEPGATYGEHYDNVFMRVKGTIPSSELDWLRDDLARTAKPTIICVHQPLDAEYETLAGGPPITNHVEVQQVLRESGVVIAVFQGHDHENRHALLDGIHYVTFAAMVDHYVESTPPTWAQVTLDPLSQTISIDGFGLQCDWDLTY